MKTFIFNGKLQDSDARRAWGKLARLHVTLRREFVCSYSMHLKR